MTTQINVLIVDDMVAIRESLVAYLEDFGFAMTAAGSIREATQILNEQPIDVTILDLRLPDGSGECFCRTILKSWPRVLCLFYTGSPEHQMPPDLKDHPRICQRILQKPLMDMTRIVGLIREMVARRDTEARAFPPQGGVDRV